MPPLSYGLSSYERAEGDLPGLPVVNMYAEETASEGIVLQSRPPLVDRGADLGTGPVRALYKRDGVVGGRLFGVSANSFFDVSADVGTINGTGPVSIAGNDVGIMVCAGGDLFTYDGVTFSQVPLPDDFQAVKVAEGSSRFVVLRKDSGRFYFTPPLNRTVDALDFATAESESDELLDALFIDDILILFGRETVEFWPNTTDNNLPFQPLEGRVLERGIKATGCASTLGSTFAWVTNQNTVCVSDENNVISNPGLQERIESSTDVSLFNFFIDGTEFLALRLDDETQVYNVRAGTWSKFESVLDGNWAAVCHAQGVFGALDGKTLEFGAGYEELGGPMERRWVAGFPLNGEPVDVSNLRIRVNPGQTDFLSGPFADPIIEVRISRDAGQTWGNWKHTNLGAQGNYRKKVEWRTLGLASRPGFMAEFRLTDPVALRVSGVFINEGVGGR
jgi:hypothetical protein